VDSKTKQLDEIIEMAREAGIPGAWDLNWFDPYLERFAALVAAHEREECAKLCDLHVGIWIIPAGPAQCAAAIRRRGVK
jgi:hypothetical protein